MKNLNIEALGLQEMTKEEMREIVGGTAPHHHIEVPGGHYCSTHKTTVHNCNCSKALHGH